MDLEQFWTDLMRQIKSYPNVNASQVDAFFSRVQLQAASPGFVMLTSDNSFIKNWIETHYLKDIQRALEDLYGIEYLVQIEIDPEAAAAAQEANGQNQSQVQNQEATQDPARNKVPKVPSEVVIDSTAPTVGDVPSTNRVEAESVKPAPTAANQSLVDTATATPVKPKSAANSGFNALTFDNFVIGDSNQMAYSMAVEVAERPGSTALNPLFIYGRSGVGKTHLLCAIKNYIEEQYPDFNVCYIDSMELVNRYSDAAMEKSVDKHSFKNFERYFQENDVLLIDDVQSLRGKGGTLKALFGILNQFSAKGKQVVMSADRAPSNIDLDERYTTRFNSGATSEIQPPDDETKRSIIRRFIKQYQDEEGLPFEISDKVLDYIVENSSSNVRELKSAITNVIFVLKNGRTHELTENDVAKLLGNHFLGGGKKRVTIEMVQSCVEEYYKVDHKELVGKKREKRIAHPRQVAMYLCRDLTEETLKSVGKAFNRDHTTVMHSCDLIGDQIEGDRDLWEKVEIIKGMIRDKQY